MEDFLPTNPSPSRFRDLSSSLSWVYIASGEPVELPLVSVPCRVILWRYDETPALLGAFVDGLDNVDQLLFILENPVHFVIVSRPEVTHL